MKIWVGDVVKKAVFDKENQHISMKKLAQLLAISRTQLYTIVNNPLMSPIYAIRIGKLIGVDFAKTVRELEPYQTSLALPADSKEDQIINNYKDDINDLQKKIISLLEDNGSLKAQLQVCKELLEDKK